MDKCKKCEKEAPDDELKWHDGLCMYCFDDEHYDPPIWAYYGDYNWNKI